MSIGEEDRLALLAKLTEALGEREARVLMQSVPPVDYHQLATKTDLATEAGMLRTEMGMLRTEMDMLRIEMRAEFTAVRSEIELVRADLTHQMTMHARTTILTQFASMIGLAATVAAIT